MMRVAPLLAAALLAAGCSTVGNVLKKTGQVLMDPSIQVGAAEDQATQIALSLYALDDVNPNTDSMPAGPAPEAASATRFPPRSHEGPYAVNLNSQTRGGLVSSLRDLLDYLEGEGPPAPDAGAARPPASARNTAAGDPGDAEVGRSADLPLPLAAADTGAAGGPGMPRASLGPGQYNGGSTLSSVPPPAEKPAGGAATPVAFRILQLKDDSLLLSADSEQIDKNLKKALGSTYVSEDDYVLQPGQFKFVGFTALKSETRYVAVIADFHDRNGATWRQAVRLEPTGRKYALLVTLRGTRVSITDESYRPPQPPSQPSARP